MADLNSQLRTWFLVFCVQQDWILFVEEIIWERERGAVHAVMKKKYSLWLLLWVCNAYLRQLSEENANLQEHVERETHEKKRLSRNNEELLWLLQTSPHLSPSSSPSHRVFFPGFDNPPYPGSPSPGTPTHSCSPGPCTPAHKVGSPGPGTPTHRASPAARSSPARIPNANTLPR